MAVLSCYSLILRPKIVTTANTKTANSEGHLYLSIYQWRRVDTPWQISCTLRTRTGSFLIPSFYKGIKMYKGFNPFPEPLNLNTKYIFVLPFSLIEHSWLCQIELPDWEGKHLKKIGLIKVKRSGLNTVSRLRHWSFSEISILN